MERNLFRKTLKSFKPLPTKPSWAIEIENKLVDLEDCSRRDNLQINGIKEGKYETWEECGRKGKFFSGGKTRYGH